MEKSNSYQNTKFNNISVLRVFSMFMVFAFHIILGYTMNLETARKYFPLFVGVEIFFFISGYLYSTKKINNYKDFYLKRIKKIHIPYYFVIFVLFIIYLFVDRSKLSARNIFSTLFIFTILNEPGLSSIGNMWYLFSAFLCYFTIPVLQWIKQNLKTNNHKKISILILCLIFIADIIISISNVSPVFSCFIIGYFISNQNKEELSSKPFKFSMNIKPTILTIISFLLSCISYFICTVIMANTVSTFIFIIKIILRYISLTVMGTSISVLFIGLLTNLNNKKIPWIISFFDKISFEFYLIHSVFILGKLKLIYISTIPVLNVLIVFVCSIIASIIISLASKLITKVIDIIIERIKKRNRLTKEKI